MQFVGGAVDLNDREIRVGVNPNDGATIDAAVEEVDFNADRAVNDVIVGDDVPVRCRSRSPCPYPEIKLS